MGANEILVNEELPSAGRLADNNANIRGVQITVLLVYKPYIRCVIEIT